MGCGWHELKGHDVVLDHQVFQLNEEMIALRRAHLEVRILPPPTAMRGSPSLESRVC